MAAQTQSSRRLAAALFLSVGLTATGLALLAYGTGFLKSTELSTVDYRFSWHYRLWGKDPPSNLTVVAIDEDSFTAFNNAGLSGRWPFPRKRFAQVINRLKADGAKVIAYDIQFTEPTSPVEAGGVEKAEEQDTALLDAVANAGNVVLATTAADEKGRTGVFGGDEVVRSVHARVGNGRFPRDPGSFLRRVAYKVSNLKSFSLVVTERATGKEITPADFGHRKTNWIDFVGPPETIETHSFSDVYFGKFQPGTFRGKLIVVGPSAETLHDIHPTSSGDGMSGAEVQANAISTALRDFPLTSIPGWLVVLSIALVGLLAPLASFRLSLLWTLMLAVTTAAAYIVATQVAFDHGWVISFVYPFGALVLSSVGSLGAHYLLAAFERERVRDVFSRFVPESVVEQVLARTDDDLRLGGISLVGTIMFTDLRGFTTFSESLPAAQVIEALNNYLSEMTDVILENGGTLVSYEGDGIMAVFGAPIEQDDHADRAVAAAREMLLDRLPRWNAWLRERELSDGFKMGIGLNTGSFMSGNVGSERRLEYTAIGDTTNTASRLQGMTKGQAYLLYMADSTREALLREVDDLVFVDEVEVRGRQSKVKIWSLEAANSEAFDAREAAAAAGS
jgi:adenylate cyclase